MYGDSKSGDYNVSLMRLDRSIFVTSAIEAGGTIATLSARVDADIASWPLKDLVKWVRFGVGANDVNDAIEEATWKGQLGYVLDALHVGMPNAKIGAALPWRRGYDAGCDTLSEWITDVVAERSPWAFVADDERIWLEGGDDGVTMTPDGVHPNDLGDATGAAAYLEAMRAQGY